MAKIDIFENLSFSEEERRSDLMRLNELIQVAILTSNAKIFSMPFVDFDKYFHESDLHKLFNICIWLHFNEVV